jgi:hypothetical protein
VATIASIRSNGHLFKFDTRIIGDYGTVVPIWVADASSISEFHGTRLTLQLKEGWDRNAEIGELKTFNFAFLLIRMNAYAHKTQLSKHRRLDGHQRRPKTISSMAPRHGVAISTAAVGEIEKSDVYIVRQDLVEKMPPEAKRVNVKKR